MLFIYKMSSNIITIDGLIGAGKSSTLVNIWDNYDIYIRVEPIELWKPYLERIYKYNDSYYEFQKQIWKDVCCFENPFGHRKLLIERSPYFIRKTFIQYLLFKNKITKEQYDHLLQLHEQSDNIWKPKTMIYLRITPEKALERIKLRNRDNENYIDIDYLYELYNLHEKAYEDAINEGYNIHIVDANRNLDEIVKDVINIIGVDIQ